MENQHLHITISQDEPGAQYYWRICDEEWVIDRGRESNLKRAVLAILNSDALRLETGNISLLFKNPGGKEFFGLLDISKEPTDKRAEEIVDGILSHLVKVGA